MEETSLEGGRSSNYKRNKFREMKVFNVMEENTLEGQRSSK